MSTDARTPIEKKPGRVLFEWKNGSTWYRLVRCSERVQETGTPWALEECSTDAAGGRCWAPVKAHGEVALFDGLEQAAKWINRAREAIAPIGTQFHIPGHGRGTNSRGEEVGRILTSAECDAIKELQMHPERGSV